MVSELGLYGAVNFSDFFVEDDFVEFPDHLTGREFAKISALLAGRAIGMLLGQIGEVPAFFDLGLNIFAGRFGGYENMTGFGS